MSLVHCRVRKALHNTCNGLGECGRLSYECPPLPCVFGGSPGANPIWKSKKQHQARQGARQWWAWETDV